MSKERARRREVREREAAQRLAAREAAERRSARRRAVFAPITTPLRRLRTTLSTGRQSGTLAQRKRLRIRLILATLIFVQVVVWVVRPDWAARLAALVIAALAFPVIAAFAL